MKSITTAIKTLKNNGVIIFPSDTVWGVGCLLRPKAVEKLYQIKKRESSKPTGIYVRDLEMASIYGSLNQHAFELASQYWPGALSIVVKARETVPKQIMGETDTVSLRIPNHPVLNQLLAHLDEPMVQTSANFSGEDAPKTFEEINPQLITMVDYVLPGLANQDSPSTIVDATDPIIKVLRVGPIQLQ